MTEPARDAAADARRAFDFVAWVLGGLAVFVGALWVADHTGRFFWVLALAGLAMVLWGAWRAVATIVPLMLVSPRYGLVMLAVAGALAWGISAAWNPVLTRLDGGSAIQGRLVDEEHGFSMEFPSGWTRRHREGFLAHALGPDAAPAGCRPELGVLRYELAASERSLLGLVDRVRRVITRSDGLVIERTRIYRDAGGRELGEIAYRSEKTAWLASLVLDGERGYALQGISCPDRAEQDRIAYRAIAATFRAGGPSR